MPAAVHLESGAGRIPRDETEQGGQSDPQGVPQQLDRGQPSGCLAGGGRFNHHHSLLAGISRRIRGRGGPQSLHVNIEIMYHPVEDQIDKYRVVRFTVEPFSIKHEFVPISDKTEDITANDDVFPRIMEWEVIKDPIASCNPNIPLSEREHTSYDMVTDINRVPQPASGKVLFTYDVHWEKNDDSTYAVPFTTMLLLIVLWFGISSPLVFLGAYFGYKQDAIEFPVKTSSIPRQIPDQPWFMRVPLTLVIGGILPFGTCFVELYFIMASVWMGYYYYVFGILLLVFFILIITVAETTLLFNYFQLCKEDYHWWWRSFGTAGSIAVYVFLYSFVYFQELEANGFAAYFLYFGYMGLASVGLFLMAGFIGVASSLWFNITIFGSLKVE